MSLSSCCRCKKSLDNTDVIKCDGNCGKIYHISNECSGKGVSKELVEAKQENFRVKFYCSECDKFHSISKLYAAIKSLEEKIDTQEKNYQEIKTILNNNKEETMKELKENEREMKKSMKEDTEFIKENLELIKDVVNIREPKKITYADKLKRFVNEPMVLVKPKGQQDCNKTKKDFMTNINPASIKLNHVKEISKGGIALACGSKHQSDDLVKLATEKLGDEYEIKMTELRKPKIKVIGMYEKFENEELVGKIKEQNEFLKDSDMKVTHTYKGVHNNFSAVIEIDGNHFAKAMEVGRLFIDLQSCKVFEDIQVMRCFNCSRYYHKAKECPNKLSCQECGEEHLTSKCNNDIKKCVNCEHAVKTYNVKYDINHAVYDRNCNVFVKKMHMLRRRIEYNK